MNSRRIAAVVCGVVALAAMPVTVQAKPNELLNGGLSPSSGTTATSFTLSVQYRSDKDFAATKVVALVAGKTVTLRLVAGTTVNGTFRGTSKVPAGRWTVRFEAQAAKGPTVTLVGPTLLVSPPQPPKPKPTVAPTRTPPPTPKPTNEPSREPPSPRPTPRPVNPREIPSASHAANASPGAGGGSGSSSAPSGSSSPTELAGGGATSGTSGTGGAGNAGPPLSRLGILGFAMLSVLGFIVLSRRRAAEPSVPPDESAVPVPRSVSSIASAQSTPQTDDPILAAMGLGRRVVPPAAINAPTTRAVRSGRGERPARPIQ